MTSLRYPPSPWPSRRVPPWMRPHLATPPHPWWCRTARRSRRRWEFANPVWATGNLPRKPHRCTHHHRRHPHFLMVRMACLLILAVAFIRGGLSRHVSRVGSTLRSPVPASLHLLALQLMPSLFGLWAPERPLFTHTLLGFIHATQRGRKG